MPKDQVLNLLTQPSTFRGIAGLVSSILLAFGIPLTVVTPILGAGLSLIEILRNENAPKSTQPTSDKPQ